ncbi:MAG: PP2C family protein-serine/threonine phosphatase [Bacillota bacterium]
MNATKGIDFGLFTMKGPDKKINEDYIEYTSSYLNQNEEAHILIAADGMGGHTFGDIASFYAANYILKWWRTKLIKHDNSERFLEDCQDTIAGIFHVINQKLIDIGKREDHHLGTTLSVLIIVGDQYLICHVGDTRIYRVRKPIAIRLEESYDTIDLEQSKRFVQLTKDHTWARMQVENGALSEREAEKDDKSHLLTQCMGVKGEIDPFVSMDTCSEEEHFILCTDGLYSLFTKEDLHKQFQEGLEREHSLQKIAEHFCNLARDANYHDDVSVLILGRKGR